MDRIIINEVKGVYDITSKSLKLLSENKKIYTK